MLKTIIIHTENKNHLQNLLIELSNDFEKSGCKLFLHSKNYIPWSDDFIKNEILSYQEYYAYPTNKNIVDSIIELVLKSTTEDIIIIDENPNTNKYIGKRSDFLKSNLDTKYKSLDWFLVDVNTQIDNKETPMYFFIPNQSNEDSLRYFKKIDSPLFNERIIYIDGGLGDHIMALPLLEKLQNNIHICCKYPFIFDHLNVRGYVNWFDDLFGGYNRFVYEHGSSTNSPTIIDAFFSLYDENRTETDNLKYNGKRQPVESLKQITSKIALICTSAAKIQNQDSNKDWKDVRWLNLVNELQKNGYYVIQVGTARDNQIPRINLKFLDKPISELAWLVGRSNLWISVDTFFHHFASAIKPDVGICLTPFYNDHAKHSGVKYIEKDCGKNYWDRRWWLDLQQPERKECMDLITVNDVISVIKNSEEQKDEKVVLVCIAKDEDLYIEEWINYNLKLGFDEIFIFQNDWDYKIENPKVHCEKYNGKNQQHNCYNDFIINNFKKYKWVAFFDVDEFLVLKKHNNIKEFIKDYDNYDSIGINWVLFGDNNLSNQPINSYSVLDRFTKRQLGVNRHIKSIVKISKDLRFISNAHCIENLTWVDTNYNIGQGPYNDSGDDKVAQINHYFVKTKEEFSKKIERGRADTEHKRVWDEFDLHNFNEISDFSSTQVLKKTSFVEFIIPTFYRINQLKSMLSSLMCQTDEDWSAHVVIDKVYDQEIIDLVNSFNTHRIYYSLTDKNYNDFGHTPREIGKNSSNAEYIILTGDDNYYTPNFVEELKIAAKSNPILIYWDMIHSHRHYQTHKHYAYWKSLLINCGIDMGSFATRRDILSMENLNVNNFSADGEILESILSKHAKNYTTYKNTIYQMVSDNDFNKPLIDFDNVVKIDKVLFVHN